MTQANASCGAGVYESGERCPTTRTQLWGPKTVPRSHTLMRCNRFPRSGRECEHGIVKAQPDGLIGYAISEWELTAVGFSDLHPPDKVGFVLADELHIEANGREVVGRAGDSIRVPAGSIGKYWAPQYARMIGIYGPNPEGAMSEYIKYWEIDSPTHTKVSIRCIKGAGVLGPRV